MSIYENKNFIHFLRNAELGVLKPKQSLQEVLELLEKPDHTGKISERFVVLHYDNLLITFYDEILVMVNIQFRRG